MTVHDLGPDWIELQYTSLGRPKRALWPCSVMTSPTPGVEPDLLTRDSGNVAATACVAAAWNVIKPFFKTTDQLDAYRVFHKASPTAPPVFLYTAPMGLAGTSAIANVPYSEAVFTFKTPTPGNLKMYFMEGVFATDLQYQLPYPADAAIDAFTDFILGPDDFIIGRNGDFPLAGIRLTTKQNDFYRRKYKL